MSTGDIFLGLLAILFPPVAVWIKRGICSAASLLNILLSCVGYVPGLIHAWYIIARYPDEDLAYEEIPEGGHVTYYYVSREPSAGGPPTHGAPGAGSRIPGGSADSASGWPAGSSTQQESVSYGTLGSQPQQWQQEGQGAEYYAPAEGASAGAKAPPTYAEAIRGDNKVQTT